MKYTFPFETTDELVRKITSEQQFSWAYAKGENPDAPVDQQYFMAFTSADLYVFSATLVFDDQLFGEFDDSDLCYEIPNFNAFSEAMCNEFSRERAIEKYWISECVYKDKLMINNSAPMPALPVLKEPNYRHQKEIRLCIQPYGDTTEPVVIKSKRISKFCRIRKKLL